MSSSASLPKVAPVAFLDGESGPWVGPSLEVGPHGDGEGVLAEVEALGVGDGQCAAIRDAETL